MKILPQVLCLKFSEIFKITSSKNAHESLRDARIICHKYMRRSERHFSVGLGALDYRDM